MWNDIQRFALMLTAAFVRDEDGQALVEYSLILALISVVAISVLQLIGTNVFNELTKVANAL
jgi:pilus assembly protein Flp/PilA